MSHQPSVKHSSPKETPKHLHIPPVNSFRPISPSSISSSSRYGKDSSSNTIRSGAETPSSFSNVYLKNLSQIVLKTNSTNPEPSTTTSRANDNPLFRPLVKQYSLDHQKMLKAVKKNSNSFSPKKHLSNEKKGSPVHEQSTFSAISAQRINEGQFLKSSTDDLVHQEASTKSPQKRLAINRSQRASHGPELHNAKQGSSPSERSNRKEHVHPDHKEEASYLGIRKMRQDYYDSPRSIRSQGGYHFSKRTSTDFTISVHQSELSSRYSQLDDKASLNMSNSPLTLRERTESEVVTETLHTDISLLDVVSNPQHKSSPTNGYTEGFSSFHKNRPDYNHKIFSPTVRKSKIEIIKQHLDEPKNIDLILVDGNWRSINDILEVSHLQQSLAESVSKNNADQNMTQKRRPIKSRSTNQLDLLHMIGDKHAEQQVKSEIIADAPKKANSFKKQKSHDNLAKKSSKIENLFTHHKRSEATTPRIDDLFTHHRRNEAKTTQIHVLPPQNEEQTALVSSYIENQEGVGSEENFKKSNLNRETLESDSMPKIQELPSKEEESATSVSNHPFIQEETEKPKKSKFNRETEPSPNESQHKQDLKDIPEKKTQIHEVQAKIESEIPTQKQEQQSSSLEETSNETHQTSLSADIIVHQIKCPVENVICEVEEEQEPGNEEQETHQKVEEKIPPGEASAPNRGENLIQELSCPPTASEKDSFVESVSDSVHIEEKKETINAVKLSQQEEISTVPSKGETLTDSPEKESKQQPILNSVTINTASEPIHIEEKKEEKSNEKIIHKVEETISAKGILTIPSKDEAQSGVSEKEIPHQLNMRSSTVESTPKILHTEEKKDLSHDGSQTDKKVENLHDLSSPSSFLESEDRSHTHDWNHLLGDSLKIKRFGEHYHSSQNALDDQDQEHEQDITTIFEENIAKFETLKKLNNQDGAVQLLKEVSDDLERYVKEKIKPQEEAPAKVLKIHVYNRLGVEYYEKGQYEETLQQCKKALEIDHSNIQALFKLYQTNTKLGKKEQASAVIKRVRKIMQNPFLYQYNQQFILDKFTMPTQTNSQSNQSLQDMHDSRLSFM